jgi:hypothetical protein
VARSERARDAARPVASLDARVAAVDWARVESELDALGHARVPGLLAPAECGAVDALWDEPARFRKRVDLASHRFGDGGEYRYFARPLPPAVEGLRRACYAPLARIANAWSARLGSRERFPASLAAWLRACHAAGQSRPTPLLLHYRAGGYNRLHQDVYGALAFPLQVAVLLSRPGRDFTGGEFLLLEQRPREQARVEVVPLAQGEALVFPNRLRPARGPRGDRRVQVRHGVARVLTGHRATLGLIFHDAK